MGDVDPHERGVSRKRIAWMVGGTAGVILLSGTAWFGYAQWRQPPPVQTEAEKDQAYLDRLSAVGIEVKDRDIALNDGRKVCRIFTDMGSFLDAARFVRGNNPALDEVGSAYVVVTANQAICPDFGPFQRGK